MITRSFQTLTLLSLLGLSTMALADNATNTKKVLQGQVVELNAQGKLTPLADVPVSIKSGIDTAYSQANGAFKLLVPEQLSPGDKVVLSIAKKGYRLVSPYRGIIYLPKDWEREQILVRLSRMPSVAESEGSNSADHAQGPSVTTPKRFIIQVLSVADRKKAEEVTNNFLARNIPANFERNSANTDNYRVKLGPFNTVEEANTLKKQLIDENLLPKDSFVKQER